MRNNLGTLAAICSSVAVLGISAPARAEMGQNSIGPSAAFGGGVTNFGIDSKFGLSDNFSLRPFVYFPSGGTNFGGAITYDFQPKSRRGYESPITPFIGGSVDFFNSGGTNINTFSLVGGADFALTDSLQLKAAVAVPLNTDSGQITTVTLGAGFRF
jgi:opacity protein-like surface antigen